MKKNILRISILPVVILTLLAFTDLQQRGNKGGKAEKGQGEHQAGGQGPEKKGNNDPHGNNGNSQGNKGNSGVRGNSGHVRGNGNPGEHGNMGNGNGNRNSNNGNSNQGNNVQRNAGKNHVSPGNEHANNGKAGKRGTGKEVIRWDNDDRINWGLADFPTRKHPGDQKKVTICHQTGSSNPVTINVSENALQAHLNHGDQVGNCTINYSDRWPRDYIRSRENVYNSYEYTWETMSYSEALLNYALQKLLGIKTNLDRNRPSLSAQEIQRREALILELQNNVNALQTQLDLTRQKTDNVNIIILL